MQRSSLVGLGLVGLVVAFALFLRGYEPVLDLPLPALPIATWEGGAVALAGKPWLIHIWMPG